MSLHTYGEECTRMCERLIHCMGKNGVEEAVYRQSFPNSGLALE